MSKNADYNQLLTHFPKGIVAFDLETTGLSALTDKIIEIGAVKITPDGKKHFFSQLINPQINIPPHTIKIHHISNEMVRNCPLQRPVLQEFLDFIEDLPLIAHNAKFDIGFMLTALHYEKLFFHHEHKVYDSCLLARKCITPKETKNYKLGTLAEFFNENIDNQHRATDDALACLDIYNGCLLKAFGEDQKSLPNQIQASYYTMMTADLRKIDYKLPKLLRPILDLLIKREVIEIKYKGGSYKNQFRPIKPIGFIPLPKGAVLYAICLYSIQNKTFLVKKISEFRIISPEERQRWEDKLKKGLEN